MKRVKKGPEPPRLQQFRQDYPNATWKQCSRGPRKDEFQKQIKEDQGYLCAYCEIDLLEKASTTEADFRVEHFHPKSDTSSGHNWAIDWQNLLGCCHGGTRSDVGESASRFTSPDTSCDVPKGDRDLDGVILNPLQIPYSRPLFQFNRSDGQMVVDSLNCQQEGISETRAQATIDELCLNANRLTSLRKASLETLNLWLQKSIRSGRTIEETRQSLARILRPNADGKLPKFFSSIRSYLGSAAENEIATP